MSKKFNFLAHGAGTDKITGTNHTKHSKLQYTSNQHKASHAMHIEDITHELRAPERAVTFQNGRRYRQRGAQ